MAGSALLSGDDPQLDVLVTGMLDLRMLGAFSSDVVTAGTATLDVRVTGSPAEPAVAGQISIRDGNIVVRDPRIAVTGLVGTLDIARDQLDLRDMTASANGGTLRIAGSIQYPGLALTGGTIAVTGRRLGFDLPEGLRTEVDTDLRACVVSDRVVADRQRRRAAGIRTGSRSVSPDCCSLVPPLAPPRRRNKPSRALPAGCRSRSS